MASLTTRCEFPADSPWPHRAAGTAYAVHYDDDPSWAFVNLCLSFLPENAPAGLAFLSRVSAQRLHDELGAILTEHPDGTS